MSNDLNHCVLIGRLGHDPEGKSTPSGDAVTNFSIAVGKTWKDKATGEKKESVTWVNIVTWRRLAEVCHQYLHKGDRVCISGELVIRKYQDRDGNDKYATEVVAHTMQMLETKRDSSGASAERQPAADAAPAGERNFEDDDIPF